MPSSSPVSLSSAVILIKYSPTCSHTVKIRKIYDKITGNQLPVPVPLFLRELLKYLAWQDRVEQACVTYGTCSIVM